MTIPAQWTKSSHCSPDGCVEAAFTGLVRVRDSKNPDAGELVFTRAEWAAFVAGVKDGEFDLPSL